MSRTFSSMGPAALVALAIFTSGAATAVTTVKVDVEYDYDKETKCVTGIRVSVPDANYQEPHHPKNVEISQQALLTTKFEVKWNLKPANPANQANIKWQIKKMGGYSNTTKCMGQYDIPQGSSSKACVVQQIAEVGPTEVWTYDVIPEDDSKCCPVAADPAIIFRGGGGVDTDIKPFVWVLVGVAIGLLVTVLLMNRRRRVRA